MVFGIQPISALQNADRWDFQFHDPDYRQIMDELASGYPTVDFGDIITLLTDMGAFSLYRTDYFVDAGVPFLRVQNVQEYGVDLTRGSRFITPEYHAILEKSQLQPGDLLLTTKAVIGIAAVVADDIGDCNMSQNLVRIRLKDGVDPKYVAAFLNSRFGRAQTAAAATGNSQKYLNFAKIRKLRIPVPPASVQREVVQDLEAAFLQMKKSKSDAKDILKQTDCEIFELLEIAPEVMTESRYFKKHSGELRGSRLDMAFNMGFHKFDSFPEKVRLLDEVASFSTEKRDPRKRPDKKFQYVDIASIDTLLGEIGDTEQLDGKSAPSRARNVIHANDIIVSTVRPDRGAVGLVPKGLENEICSTGFCVVRALQDDDSAYLAVILRLSTTLEQFSRRSAGSSYPAILESDLRQTLIPWPAEHVRRAIVDRHQENKDRYIRARDSSVEVVKNAKLRAERLMMPTLAR